MDLGGMDLGPHYDRQGKPITFEQWGALRWKDDGTRSEYPRIELTELEGGISVSTVWLGINQMPLVNGPWIFETEIFGGPHDQERVPYHTEAEARQGHDRTVQDLIAGRRPWFLSDDDDEP